MNEYFYCNVYDKKDRFWQLRAEYNPRKEEWKLIDAETKLTKKKIPFITEDQQWIQKRLEFDLQGLNWFEFPYRD